MEAVWQLNQRQKIAGLLVPLPLLQVHWPVVLVLAFPKDYHPALHNVSLLKTLLPPVGNAQMSAWATKLLARSGAEPCLLPQSVFPVLLPLRLLQSSCIILQGCRMVQKDLICTFASLQWECSASTGIDIPPEWVLSMGWCGAAPLKGIFGCAMKDPAVISTLSNGLGSRTEMPW